jgi:hypothetical protein
LLRYNAREKFSLFDRNKREGKEDEPRQNAIEISENGLVVLGAPAEPRGLSSVCQSVSEGTLSG